MSAHRLIRYPFDGTSIVPFDAYGRSLLRHRRSLLIGRVPRQRNDARPAVSCRAMPHVSAGREGEIGYYFIRSRSFQCLIRYFVSE